VGNNRYILGKRNFDGSVARVVEYMPEHREKQNANAHLIAAAPELYGNAEFLCARLRELESLILDDEVGREYYGHCSPARARLESVLAKARGEHD
jgi:hypothetical protein